MFNCFLAESHALVAECSFERLGSKFSLRVNPVLPEIAAKVTSRLKIIAAKTCCLRPQKLEDGLKWYAIYAPSKVICG